MVSDFKTAYGSREGDEWKQIRELCHPAADAAPELQVAVHADTEEADVVHETAGEVAGDVASTDALLGFIREREHAQLRRFGAQHGTPPPPTPPKCLFKLLFGLPVTTEYNEECIYGYTADQDFWYTD